MSSMTATELEIQQRGEAFRRALERLEREYNCTATTVPIWLPNVSGTFVLGFDPQVRVGPVPMKPVEEEKEGE